MKKKVKTITVLINTCRGGVLEIRVLYNILKMCCHKFKVKVSQTNSVEFSLKSLSHLILKICKVLWASTCMLDLLSNVTCFVCVNLIIPGSVLC